MCLCLFVRVRLCVRVRVHVYMRVRVHVRVRVRVHVYVHVYVHVCVCVCVCGVCVSTVTTTNSAPKEKTPAPALAPKSNISRHPRATEHYNVVSGDHVGLHAARAAAASHLCCAHVNTTTVSHPSRLSTSHSLAPYTLYPVPPAVSTPSP